MRFAELSTGFITHMVLAAYQAERAQVKNPELLTNAELLDLYYAYMGR